MINCLCIPSVVLEPTPNNLKHIVYKGIHLPFMNLHTYSLIFT